MEVINLLNYPALCVTRKESTCTSVKLDFTNLTVGVASGCLRVVLAGVQPPGCILFYCFKMPLVYLGCFYCTEQSQWLLEYSSSCCCRKLRASPWRRLTGSCAQRGTVGSDHGRQTSDFVYSPWVLLPGRFYHSAECCSSIGWRTTSPQYQRVQC